MFNKCIRIGSVLAGMFALSLLGAASVHALTTVPSVMNFQGRLSDSSGAAKANGTYNLRFRLYDASTGGTLKWSEDRLVSAGQGVSLTNGMFTTQLGQVTPLPTSLFNGGLLYLEVELPTPASATSGSPVWSEGPMTPRNVMATSPYAYNADTLDGIDSTGFAQLAGNNVFTGLNTFRPTTNSQNAFTIQNSTSQNIVQVDTTNAGTVTLLGNNSGEPGPWQTSANALPAGRAGQTSVTANGYIYVIGGADDTWRTTVFYAKLNTDGSVGTWQTATNSLPAPRYQHNSVVANGYLYVIGGYDGTTYATVFYAKLNTDGSVGTWQTATNSLPAPRYNQSTVVANGYMYVLGGSDGAAHQSTVFYTRLNADGSVSSWQVATNALPAVEQALTSVISNGYIYAMGGISNAGAAAALYYAKLNTDGSVGTWQTATNSLPAPRYNQSTVVANGYMYVLGGNNGSTRQSTVFYTRLNADGSVGTWQTATNALPDIRAAQQSVVVNGYVYVIGGNGSSTPAYQSTVLYSRLGGVVSVGGSLDLVGSQGQTLADGGDSSTGSTGGSITAGNITAVGSLQVQGQSLFNDSVSVNRDFTVGNNLLTVDDNNAGTVTLLGNNSGEVGEWKSGSALPGNRANATAVTANGYAYYIGGYDGSSVQKTVYYAKLNADGSMGAWGTTTPLPTPVGLNDHSSVVANGYIYVIGGNSSSAYTANTYYAKLNADGTVGAWQSAAAIPANMTAHSSVVANGYVYVIGGILTGPIPQTTTYYAKLNADGTVGAWQTSSVSLPAGRWLHKSVVANGYVYAIGGYGTASEATVYYAKLNPTTGGLVEPAGAPAGKWGTTTALPVVRHYFEAAIANGYVYALGSAANGMYYAKLNADGTVGAWQTSKNPVPVTKTAPSSIVANGFVYTMGGSYTNTTFYSRLGGVVNIGGSLDLVGLQGQTLADGGDSSTGSTGGSITAGNITAVGSLQVQKQALFSDNASVLGDFSVGNGIFSTSQGTNVVQIGSSTADANAVVLVLDTKNTAGDPAGVSGGMYYNSSTGKFRCYQGSAWTNCMDGYAVGVRATSTNPASSTTYYASNMLLPLGTASSPMYIRKSGTITMAELYTRAETVAGSGEAWSFYVRVNGVTDYLVSSQSVASAERVFSNANLSIPVKEGDYVEVKTVTPAWTTAPQGVVMGGYLYVN